MPIGLPGGATVTGRPAIQAATAKGEPKAAQDIQGRQHMDLSLLLPSSPDSLLGQQKAKYVYKEQAVISKYIEREALTGLLRPWQSQV